MTSEEDFDRLLDKRPSDYLTRLIYSDWLEERNDPRAKGYIALGKLKRKTQGKGWQFMWSSDREIKIDWRRKYVLPKKWFFILQPELAFNGDTRKRAEDLAALAFSKLDLDTQESILVQAKI